MKNIEGTYDSIYTRPYAEDDYPLNDFVERVMRRVSWRLFENQENICYMLNETNTVPKLKDNIIEYMQTVIDQEFGWIRSYIISRILIEYRLSNIDLGDEGSWWLEEELGHEEYEKFEKIAREYIYKDYVKILGIEKANEYFNRIGLSDYIMEDYE